MSAHRKYTEEEKSLIKRLKWLTWKMRQSLYSIDMHQAEENIELFDDEMKNFLDVEYGDEIKEIKNKLRELMGQVK